MKLPLITHDDAKKSLETLKGFYDKGFIPAEKKNYLTELKNSIGPYLGVTGSDGKTHYLLDAASQIATLGHGFNAQTFFGTAQFLESWINDTRSKQFKSMRESYVQFFKRKLGWKKTFATFLNSGAEANEYALGLCYKKRVHKNANKVLAFTGSFHGRMMVTLAATWNKSKRAPFEWDRFLASYVPYPESLDGTIIKDFPENWREIWTNSALKDFQLPSSWTYIGLSDLSLKTEIDSLIEIRHRLLSKEIFAILIEPMQCEGGDCYSTDRFHTALLLMAKTFKVPVIYDEVQTGFHLGKEFFWHREFQLKDTHDSLLAPDYVTCAKKAQIGIVLSHTDSKNIFKGEEISVASVFRGYAHAIGIDQSQLIIRELENIAKIEVEKLLRQNDKFLTRPRINGLAFAFDLRDPSLLNKFVDHRFNHGLLYYPAGDKTLRFRLNTLFKKEDITFLFERLHAITQEVCANTPSPAPSELVVNHNSATMLYEWHDLLLSAKLSKLFGLKIKSDDLLTRLELMMSKNEAFSLFEINSQNFLQYRSDIIQLQQSVYEPARQTDIEKFEYTVLNQHSICLGVKKDHKLVGIAFSGPLEIYPLERGVRQDPHFHDPHSLYMLDLTIHKEAQSLGLGMALKYALTLYSLSKGVKRIQGRNRDRMARSMLNINLSLGALEQNYIKEDYPDFKPHRDVFYYTINCEWKKPTLPLSSAISMPLYYKSLNPNYLKTQLPNIVNKICLSNFVSLDFLNAHQKVVDKLPEKLRHIYTSSGQSECVDKVAKCVWVTATKEIKEAQTYRFLTFKNHYFGNGSNLARSLSYNDDPYFDVTKLNSPNENNYHDILKQVEHELKTLKYLAVFIEPLLQKTMEKIPYEFLKGLRELTLKYQTSLIYNETASQMYRYSTKNYFVSSFADITPDAGLTYTGGQSGFVFAKKEKYLDTPLMLISTWDGDEFSFLSYFHAFNEIEQNKEEYFQTMKNFHTKLIENLSAFEMDAIKLDNGIGHFKGIIPHSMEKMFIRGEDHSMIVCPSFGVMKEYLK